MQAKKVLLVDDSKSARFILGRLLQQHEYHVEMAESAEEALGLLKANQPDAIFMDHMMPGMDGLIATSRIKQNPATAHIPIVMCSSNEGEDYLEQAVDQIGQITEACHRSDLTFGLEVEANLVGRTGHLLAEIHRRVNNPALVLVFDAANLIVQGFSPA